MSPPPSDFSDAARAALYEVIAKRRDIRAFRPGQDIPEATLLRILGAAHQAPSVGYSQPWDFVLVRSTERRTRIRESFLRCRETEAARFSPERREKYLGYRLEGIIESSLNICVTVDLRPAEEAILGTTAQPEALRWSACCAVENLWLAARAEGIGVGWVSIVEPAVLRAELALPPGIEPVAYLCVGYPVEFRDRPLLEETGWRRRRAVGDAIHEEQFHEGERLRSASAGAVAIGTEPHPGPGSVAPPGPGLPRPRTHPAAFVRRGSWPVVPPFDLAAAAASREYQLKLTKPAGSLGRLEELSAWYAGARGQFPAAAPARPELFIFAGDHGVVAEGVSGYSSAFTAGMVQNFVSGGAAVNALARSCGVDVTVVDVGVAGDLTSLPAERSARLIEAKVRAGTGNFRRGAAMTRDEAHAALDVGIELATSASEATLLCAGEMGIGNSTSAAALLSVFTGLPPEEAVGRGTGIGDDAVARKAAVIREALALHAPNPADPMGALCAVGGLELAAMAGLMLGGAAARRPVVVDGFISGAAALVAIALEPGVKDYLCLSHLSGERAHPVMCKALGMAPLLDLKMRLGEGTGAVLAAHLIRTAVEAEHGMATFATAGVPGRAGLR